MRLELLSLPQPAAEPDVDQQDARPGARFDLLRVDERGTLQHYEFWLPDEAQPGDGTPHAGLPLAEVVELFRTAINEGRLRPRSELYKQTWRDLGMVEVPFGGYECSCMQNMTPGPEQGQHYHVRVPKLEGNVVDFQWKLHIAQPNPAGVEHGWVHRTWDHKHEKFKARQGHRWQRAATLQKAWKPELNGSPVEVGDWCDKFDIPKPFLDPPATELTFSVDESKKPGEPTLLERLKDNKDFDMDALKLEPLGNGVQQLSLTTKDKDGNEHTHAINIYDNKISIVNEIVDGKAKMPDPAAIKKALELFVAAYGNDRTISVSNTDKAVESYVKAEIKKLIDDSASEFSNLKVLEPVVSHSPATPVASTPPQYRPV